MLGIEKFQGHDCEIRQAGGIKIWIELKTGYQVRRELKTEPGFLLTLEYRNFTSETIPEALFRVPSGYKTDDMVAEQVSLRGGRLGRSGYF